MAPETLPFGVGMIGEMALFHAPEGTSSTCPTHLQTVSSTRLDEQVRVMSGETPSNNWHRIGGVLAQCLSDGLAQSDPRPLPAHAAAQHALHVVGRVSFDHGQHRRAPVRKLRCVDAPRRPGVRPHIARHRPDLLPAQFAGHGGLGPGVDAHEVGLGDGAG